MKGHVQKVLDHFGTHPEPRHRGVPYEELTQRALEVLQLATQGRN